MYVIFLLDVFESAATWTLAWHALCTGWGLASFLIYPGWSLSALLVVVGVSEYLSNIWLPPENSKKETVSAWVQIFYAWRIHAMINWKLVPIVVILVSLLLNPPFLFHSMPDYTAITCASRYSHLTSS